MIMSFGLDVSCRFVVFALLAAEFINGATNFQSCDSKYNNCQLLAKGCDGSVYRCDEIGSNPLRQVALKHFHHHETFAKETRLTDLMKSSLHPEYFLTLLDTCMSSSSRRPVAVFGLITYDLFTFAAEYSETCDPGNKPPEPFDIRSISHQIIEAIATLNQMEYIHLDVKPENIGIWGVDKKSIKLFDLAFVEQIYGGKHVYPVKGTPVYMAPEILIGQELDVAQSVKPDVWSVGVTLLAVAARSMIVIPTLTNGLFDLSKLPQPMYQPCYGMFIYIYLKGLFGSAVPTKSEIERIEFACEILTETKIRELLSSDQLKVYEDYYNKLIIAAKRRLQYFGLTINEADKYIQLVQWLLTFDFYLRPTAGQAAKHDFFVISAAEPAAAASAFDSGVESPLQISGSQNILASADYEISPLVVVTKKSHTIEKDKHT